MESTAISTQPYTTSPISGTAAGVRQQVTQTSSAIEEGSCFTYSTAKLQFLCFVCRVVILVSLFLLTKVYKICNKKVTRNVFAFCFVQQKQNRLLPCRHRHLKQRRLQYVSKKLQYLQLGRLGSITNCNSISTKKEKEIGTFCHRCV